jgi:hypothetical protein
MSDFSLPEERRLAAYRALTDEGVNAPGPNLADLADSVLLGVGERFDESDPDELEPSDVAHEIADSAVPVYTSDILEAIGEDAGVACWEPELGPAFDGSPTIVNIAAGVLYELARNIAEREIQRRLEARDAEENE